MKSLESMSGNGEVDTSGTDYLREVAHAPQQSVGHTWRAAAAQRYLMSRCALDAGAQ